MLPNFTADTPMKLVPMIVTVALPPTGPTLGETDVTVGAGAV